MNLARASIGGDERLASSFTHLLYSFIGQRTSFRWPIFSFAFSCILSKRFRAVQISLAIGVEFL